jgi:hypothetical protein
VGRRNPPSDRAPLALRFLHHQWDSHEQNGGPLGVVVAGANVHDTKLLEATLDAMVVCPPLPTEQAPQHLCLDKGYDTPPARTPLRHTRTQPISAALGGEARRRERETLSSSSMGRGANVGMALQVPICPGALRSQVGELPRLREVACILIWTRIWRQLKAQTAD